MDRWLDKIPLKSPIDFADPKDWRAYIRETVPPDEVDYTLAFGTDNPVHSLL